MNDTVMLLAEQNDASGLSVMFLFVMGLCLLIPIGLFIWGLVSVLSDDRLSGVGKAAWVLALLGPTLITLIVWFAWGKNNPMQSDRMMAAPRRQPQPQGRPGQPGGQQGGNIYDSQYDPWNQ